MAYLERTARRSIIRMSELANMPSALRIWKEIERWDPVLSVEGLKPYLSAYQRFVCEPGTDDLLHTDRAFDRGRYSSDGLLAFHAVGSTGVGKDTVLEAMNIPWVLSDTERPREARDTPDKTYHFVQREQMDASIQRGELVEYTRVPYRDGLLYRYGTHATRVQQMIESGVPIFAFRTNQDGFIPISRFCEEQSIPIVRILILPNCPASEYFDRVEQERGIARVATAKAEIQYTPELYRIDAILGNPFDPVTGRPIRAASALGSWLNKTFSVRLPQPSDGVDYSS